MTLEVAVKKFNHDVHLFSNYERPLNGGVVQTILLKSAAFLTMPKPTLAAVFWALPTCLQELGYEAGMSWRTNRRIASGSCSPVERDKMYDRSKPFGP